MAHFSAWVDDGVAASSGESCMWGDGGGGSGASTGESLGGARKLIADELAGWIGRQEKVVRDLKQQQEQSNEQIRQMLDNSLARHERTIERLFAWYFQPQKDKQPMSKVFNTPSGNRHAGESPKVENAPNMVVEDVQTARPTTPARISSPHRAADSNSWVAEVNEYDAVEEVQGASSKMENSFERLRSSFDSNWGSSSSPASQKSPSMPSPTTKKGKKSLTSADGDAPTVKVPSIKALADNAIASLQLIPGEASGVSKVELSTPVSALKGPAPPGQTVQPTTPQGAPGLLSQLGLPEQQEPQQRRSRASISPLVAVIPQPQLKNVASARSSRQSMRGSRMSLVSKGSVPTKKIRKSETKEVYDSEVSQDQSESKDDKSSESSGSKSSQTGSELSGEEGQRERSRRLSKFSAWEAEVRKQAKSIHDENAGSFELCSTDQVAKAEKSKLVRIVKSMAFDYVSAVLLASNAILIGCQVNDQLIQLHDNPPVVFDILNTIYGLLFLAELVLRIAADGPREYFLGHSMIWNWFDFIVVTLQVAEIIARFLLQGGAVPKYFIMGRLVRVARMARVVRVIRVMRFFRAFRILLTMIFGTMRNGAWATLLLVLIMYIFAIVFTQSLGDYLMDHGGISARDDPDNERLIFYYGSLLRAILTLFKSIIGGVDWEEVLIPLSGVGWVLVCLFLGYISFVSLVVMNVVTGLFLQSAIEQAQSDQEHVIQLRLAEKQLFVSRLHALFHELDTSCDGCISLSEFESHLKNEQMQAMLQTFEIDNADAWTLFKLLDTDGGGSVDIDEFVDGCIRLKGSAKSIQMAQIMYHHKWIMDKLTDLSNIISKELRPMGANQGMLATYVMNLSNELAKVNVVHQDSDTESMYELTEVEPGNEPELQPKK